MYAGMLPALYCIKDVNVSVKGRTLVVSRGCRQQTFHSDLLNAFWNKENDKQLNNVEIENEATWYFAMAGGRFEMVL